MAFNYDSAAELTIGATGGYRIQIEIDGIASHAGARPEKGISAITVAALAIADLEKNGWLGAIKKGNNKGTSNIGIIRAGQATNVMCPHAELKAEARSHDPAFRKRILQEYRRA